MTIAEAIERLDTENPNQVPFITKVIWLDQLDRLTKIEAIDSHEGGEDSSFSGYDACTDTDTVLLIPAPYSECYVYWLMSRVDLYNKELAKYQNDMILYNAHWEAYIAWYNRSHQPLTTHFKL